MINQAKINDAVNAIQETTTNEELLTAALKDVDADTIMVMLRNVYCYGLKTALEGVSQAEEDIEAEARAKHEETIKIVEDPSSPEVFDEIFNRTPAMTD